MKNDSIKKMILKNSIILTNKQLFWHYSVIIIFLIPPLMNLIDIFNYYVTHTYNGIRTVGEMASWSYFSLIPAIVFYYIQKSRLKFKSIYISVESNTFIEVAKATASKLGCTIVEQKSNLIVAKSGFSLRSWGELITIVRDKDKILINSICDPDNTVSVASWGANKLNINTFEQHLQMKCK